MTSGELTTICSAIAIGLGGIGTVIRWSAQRIANVIEHGNKERHDVIERNTTALLGVTGAVAEMRGIVGQARDASVEAREAVQDVADEVSAAHGVEPEVATVELEADEELHLAPTRRTPNGGYVVVKRRGTRS